MNKRAQVTIFIILAMIIIIAILLIMFLGGKNRQDPPTEVNAESFIKDCVEESLEESIEEVMKNGGQIIPEQKIQINDLNYNYLCYQADYYQGCYNIHPMLEEKTESELKKDTEESVEDCFIELESEMEKKGYDYTHSSTTYSINILPGKVEYKIEKKVNIAKGETSQSFKEFEGKINTPLYDLIKVARDVINSESQFCNFEYNGYMLLYPQYDIKRFDYEGSKIYTLVDRQSKEEFKFAVRSCVFPPGI